MPGDYLFPPIPQPSLLTKLTGNTVLSLAMLGTLVSLQGFSLSIGALTGAGVCHVMGPGSLTGSLSLSLVSGQSVIVNIDNAIASVTVGATGPTGATGATGAAGAPGVQGPQVSAPRIYADATAALADGVALGAVYQKPDFSAAVVAFPITLGPSVAIMGDSMTEQATSGLNDLSAFGAAVQARSRCGSKFDFVPNGSGQLRFATYGLTSAQLISNWLPQVLASAAKVCVFMCGANDAVQSVLTATFIANVQSIASQLRSKGIAAIFLAPPPMPLTYAGPPSNSGGAISARIAAYWAALPAALAAVGCLFVPCPTALEAAPGSRNGIGNSSYFSDDLHPNYTGMAWYGRALSTLLSSGFNMPGDPFAMGGTDITSNALLAGTSGQPTDWFNPSVPSGATLNGKSLVNLGGGKNAWQLDYSQGSSTGSLSLAWAGSQVGGSAVGKTVDAVMRIKVISGSFSYAKLANFIYGGASGVSYDQRVATGVIYGPTLLPSDGEMVLRTPKTVVGSGATLCGPLLEIVGTGVIQIYDPRSRSF